QRRVDDVQRANADAGGFLHLSFQGARLYRLVDDVDMDENAAPRMDDNIRRCRNSCFLNAVDSFKLLCEPTLDGCGHSYSCSRGTMPLILANIAHLLRVCANEKERRHDVAPRSGKRCALAARYSSIVSGVVRRCVVRPRPPEP